LGGYTSAYGRMPPQLHHNFEKEKEKENTSLN
jgi:hypothetical protein